MKQKILLLLLVMVATGASAQKDYCDMRRLQSKLEEGLTADFEHRKDKRQVLKTIDVLKNEKDEFRQEFWNDGRTVIGTLFNPYYLDFLKEDKNYDRGQVEVDCERNRQVDTAITCVTHDFDIVGKTVKERNTNLIVTAEKLGRYTMLVYRNAKGAPVKAYYYSEFDDVNLNTWTYMFHYILDGNYMLANGKNAVFGFRQKFYEGDKYNTDPGIYRYQINPEEKSIEIIYGEGRVSNGDPSHPNYNVAPGGGGAGALMGPMTWQVKFTEQGLDATVLVDEKFVDHYPRLQEGENVLTKVQGPWQELNGKWTFASVIPLTHEILKLFPKDVLELMRAEIYARHGDTFKSAANQKYFNQQPWYKKSNKPVVLSDIEKFNVALIKQVMATK